MSAATAQEAGEISKGHAHNRAVRAMCKEILRDLWLADRAHYGLPAHHDAGSQEVVGGQALTLKETA